MLIDATILSDKSEILQKKYTELINSGVLPEKILVLCLNSYKKQIFLKAVEDCVKIPVYGKYNIQTFYGLCYNSITDNWVEIEKSIKKGKPFILPNLCGLELSRNLLDKSLKDETFKDYFSKTNLLHQMFKRMQLIVLNRLSEKSVAKKSALLKEAFFDDTVKVYNDFRKLTNEYRSFDYLRQLSILPFILKNTDYFKKIEYLFADDADELVFAEFDFIRSLKPQLKDFFIAYDTNGASRCGYLSAYKTSVFEYEKIFGETAEKLIGNSVAEDEADLVFKNITDNIKTSTDKISFKSFIKRLEMLDCAFEQMKTLIKRGAKPSDFTIITPVADDMLKMSFERFFNDIDVKYQIISGSKKPKDTVILRNVFTFLKILHPEWSIKIEPFEYRVFFFDCLNIPAKYSQKAVNRCVREGALTDFEFENPQYFEKYNKFRDFIKDLQNKELKFSAEILEFYKYFYKNEIIEKEIKDFNFFLKEVRSFEKAFGNLSEEERKNIILQFQNGIISENPSVAEEIDDSAVIISTPQKVIDFEIKRKYQIWLDISNDLWTMRDTGVLYNAWVFNAEWQDKEFSVEDNLRLSAEKNARVIRKLFLCCEKKIYAYFSQYDSSGYENIGVLQSYFISDETENQTQKKFSITPRPDQIKVLEYKGGKAAVNAVPGAGKTTVLTALIIKMIENGVKPSGIYVLTYMESAAANIRDKIKRALPNLTEIPNVSTIHGLCFKIIKENNNYTRINLADNIEIADENTRQKILNDCITKLGLSTDDSDDYLNGISAVKLSPNGIKPLKYLKNGKDFDKLFELYDKNMRQAGLIDYDDMIKYAVELTEKHEDIRNVYADSCKYIFEDEAQDSSELQQKLLLMLSSKHGNLLKIGDINQAITSSFTDSDPKCFKKYFEENEQMVMKSSQRSSVQIQILANQLIDYSKTKNDLKDTFFDSKLTPTERNPKTDKEPEFLLFESTDDEKFFVLNALREISKNQKDMTIAILLRYNSQIITWADFLSKNGITVTTRTDYLGQKNIFKVISAYLHFLQFPLVKDNVCRLAKALKDANIINFSKTELEYLKGLKTPFINSFDEDLSENLTHLWWDLQFNDDLTYIPPEDAVIKIGLKYFSTVNEKSNIYLISTIVKRLAMTYKKQEEVISKLDDIAQKPIGSAFKFFEDEQVENNLSVRLMTMHKSKGDEFDIVFIPETSEYSYPLKVQEIRANSTFAENIKQLRIGYKIKNQIEIKTEMAEETLRLLYVGITRAKRELYITCSKKNLYGKQQAVSDLFYVMGGAEE